MKRIKFLDGHRGLAILLVVLYHAYARWPSIVPYGNRFLRLPIINKGWLGVQLFFLISGFVILMTLEKCNNFKEFIIRRWLRLFPAMFIATVIIFLSANYFFERPAGIPRIRDIIPGLTFIEPSWISMVFNVEQGLLEGAFWSLFVEVKYYFIFGLLYYYKGKDKAIWVVFSLFIANMFIKVVGTVINNGHLASLQVTMNLFSFEYFGWFTTGSLLYLYFKDKSKKLIRYAIITGMLSVAAVASAHGKPISDFISATLILLVFILPIYFNKVRKIFENKVLVYFGFISYPLYLIHENAMISMILKISKQFKYIPEILLPIIPVALLMATSHIIAKFLEPAAKKLVVKIRKNNRKTISVSSQNGL